MPQTLHKFRAGTLEEAYKAMRAKLGDRAIVLQTATITPNGVLGLLGRKLIEVTATLPEPVSLRALSSAEKKYAQTMLQRLAGQAKALEPENAPAMPGIGSDETVQDTVSYFRQVVNEAQNRLQAGASNPEPQFERMQRTADGVELTLSPAAQQRSSGAASAPTQHESILPFRKPERRAHHNSDDDIRNEIRELREMMNVLTAETPGAGLDPAFIPHYRMLLSHGVDRRLAATLVQAAASSGDVRVLRDPVVFLERMKMEVRKRVRTTGGIGLGADRRRVVALVGPTGIGKTTTLAKIAALFAVQRRARVGVITTDTYRVAATDQLNVYANIIGVEMRVVNEPREMTGALRDFKHCDLVLIDTAGGSPYNIEQLTELEKLLLVAQPDETLLLQSASTPLEDMRGILSQFARLRPSSLVFTKLDETKRYGSLFSHAAEADLPIAYLSIGQNVPDDLELAHDGFIATLVVEGEDRRGTARAKSS